LQSWENPPELERGKQQSDSKKESLLSGKKKETERKGHGEKRRTSRKEEKKGECLIGAWDGVETGRGK